MYACIVSQMEELLGSVLDYPALPSSSFKKNLATARPLPESSFPTGQVVEYNSTPVGDAPFDISRSYSDFDIMSRTPSSPEGAGPPKPGQTAVFN